MNPNTTIRCRCCGAVLDIQLQTWGERYPHLAPLYHMTCWTDPDKCKLSGVTRSLRCTSQYATEDLSEWLAVAL